MKYIFDLNDEVEVVADNFGKGEFIGMKGVIRDVAVHPETNNTIYGLEMIEGNDFVGVDDVNVELIYFIATELQ